MKKLLLSASLIVLATSPAFAENIIAERKVNAFLRPSVSLTKKKIRQEVADSSVKILMGQYLESKDVYGNKSDGFNLFDDLLQTYEKDENPNPQGGEQKNNSDHLKMTGSESIFLDSFVNFIENIKNKNERYEFADELKNHSLENKKDSSQFEMQKISEKQMHNKNSSHNHLINTQAANIGGEIQSSTREQTFTLAQKSDQEIANEKNTSTSIAERILGFEKLKIASNSESYSDYSDYMSNFLSLFLDILSNFRPKTTSEFFDTYSILTSLYPS